MKHDLRYFLQSLKKQTPELLRQVKREVSPQWELSAVQKRLEVQKRLPVLSFDRVTGSKMPVVTNLFASRAHLALALEVSPDEVVARFAEAQKNGLPTKTVSTGPVKDIVLQGDEATLSKLPLITHCEKDAGPYLTSGVTAVSYTHLTLPTILLV